MGTIVYKELKDFDEFRECVSLQKKIFKVSDIDAISPPIINMLAREYPPIGIVIGAVDKSQGGKKLAGFVCCTALLRENALYLMMVVVAQEYQNQDIGIGLLRKLREVLLAQKIKYLYCSYDPLEGNLGYFYYNKLGFWGIKYEESAYKLTTNDQPDSEIPIDKILAKWELENQITCEKVEGIYRQKLKIEEILSKYPVINENRFDDSDTVLVKIPEDFIAMQKTNFEEALNWRLNTRKIFTEYINNRGYWITELHSQKKGGKRDNYYLLGKK